MPIVLQQYREEGIEEGISQGRGAHLMLLAPLPVVQYPSGAKLLDYKKSDLPSE